MSFVFIEGHNGCLYERRIRSETRATASDQILVVDRLFRGYVWFDRTGRGIAPLRRFVRSAVQT